MRERKSVRLEPGDLSDPSVWQCIGEALVVLLGIAFVIYGVFIAAAIES